MDKRIIMIGIGQIGVGISNEFYSNMLPYSCKCSVIAMDTDATIFNNVCGPTVVSMAESTPLVSIVERLGAANVSAWFPCDWNADGTQRLGTLEIKHGAGQIRAKGLLAFVNMLSRPELKEKFLSAIDVALPELTETTVVDLYVAASLAGGTGSALFCAVALYVEKYIREKYKIEVNAKAFLVTPEVLASDHDKDFMERAHANAYAALQELHVINKITLGAPDATAFSYRLGQENDPYLGLLFDSTKEEYHAQKYTPFRDVVLFDRVPGIPSLFSYEKLWVDILTLSAIDCIEYSQHNGMAQALYHGISSIRYRFDAEKVSKQMAAQRLEDNLAGEWVPQIKELQFVWNTHNPTNSTQNLLSVCHALTEAYDENEEKKENESDNVLACKGFTYLETVIKNEIGCNIPDNLLEKTAEVRDIVISLTRFPKKAEKGRIACLLKECFSILTDYYRHCIDAVASITNSADVKKKIEHGFLESIMDAVFVEEDGEKDPVSCFIRLCRLNIEWQKKAKSLPDYSRLTWSVSKLINGKIPTEVVETVFFPYSNNETHAFSCLQKKDGSIQFPLSPDAVSRKKTEAFCALCESIAAYFQNMVESFLCDSLSKCLEERIASFYSFLTRTVKIVNVITADDEQIDGYNDGMNRSSLVVGLNEKEYGSLYEEYCSDDSLKTKEMPFLEKALKALLILGEITPSNVLAVWNEWRRELLTVVRSSTVYRKLKNKNIIESMISAFRSDGADYRPIDSVLDRLAVPSIPLRHEDIDTPDMHYCVEEKVTVFVSNYSAKVLATGFSDSSTKSNIVIKGDSHILETELFVVKEIRHLLPGQIVLMNEMQDQFGMYRDFLRSLDVADQKETQLRNPYVNRMDMMRGHLPFLNETAQRKNDEETMRALWYGLTSGSFLSEWNEDLQRFVFGVRSEGHVWDVSTDNSLIPINEPYRLLLWLRAHPRTVYQWSALFERDIQLYRMNVQNQLFQYTEQALEVILKCPFFQLMMTGLLENVQGAHAKQKYYLWQMVQDIAAENKKKAADFVTDWRLSCDFICRKMAGNSEHFANVIRTYVLSALRKKWLENVVEKKRANWIVDLTNE